MATRLAKILVVGGAGYIGSHMVKMLIDRGYQVTTLDNLSNGFRDAVVGGEFVEGDLADRDLLDRLLREGDFIGVMHFASFIMVGESVADPAIYYRNNVSNTQNLLDAMVAHDVRSLIFSSTAAIFGDPQYIPIDEKHKKQPVNPYGTTKLVVEQMLADYDRAYGLKSACLRYFNAAGADPDGLLGERHDPESHLIPLVLQVASGRRPAITVFGQDYETADGTCIRDYIHVTDLCDAHHLAMQNLWTNRTSVSYNLGNGNGFSVREVIESVARVTDKNIKVEYGASRPGDPAVLIADSSLAREQLGWSPEFHELEVIIEH
ncbi:MAG: UDP-glucose 4-epimerase GalE, partial [Desulfobulbaceae bacterium]|nr:UDP-glucose 4-epimerase GalE [Desulfobulbaceae bacterium]